MMLDQMKWIGLTIVLLGMVSPGVLGHGDRGPRIGAVDLRRVPVSQCIEVLRGEAIMADPEVEGINLVIILPPEILKKRITLIMERVPIKAALEQLCGEAGVKGWSNEDAYVIAREKPDYGGTDAELAQKANARIRKRLKGIIDPRWRVPEGARLRDVVKMLNERSLEYDPAGDGITSELVVPDKLAGLPARPMVLDNISFLSLVRYVACMNGLRVEIRDGRVLFHLAEGQKEAKAKP